MLWQEQELVNNRQQKATTGYCNIQDKNSFLAYAKFVRLTTFSVLLGPLERNNLATDDVTHRDHYRLLTGQLPMLSTMRVSYSPLRHQRFSQRSFCSSSGVKSFRILNISLVSFVLLPLIMLATVAQPIFKSPLGNLQPNRQLSGAFSE